MPKVKLLTVTCENRPGTLSYVARALGDAKVNIVAFHCGTIGQNGFVHVVVDDVECGRTELYGSGCVARRIAECRWGFGLAHRKAGSQGN